ncbi:surface glycoprotein, partial [Trypanosoma conorhini]
MDWLSLSVLSLIRTSCLLACSLPLFAARAKKPLEMCCGILDAVEDCFKFVVAVACCLALGGPALIIAGSVLLSQDDGRKAYNEAVKEFDPAPINAWTGTINGVPTNVVRKALNVHGASGATSVLRSRHSSSRSVFNA